MNDLSAQEQYEKVRLARIETMTSPDALIARIVEQAGNSPLVEKVRITEGFSNEVYRATLANGQNLIVRIHWWNSPHFEAEAWALAQCGKLQLPAPRILLLEHHIPGDIPRSACVETVVPGKTLYSLLKERIYKPEDCRPHLVELGRFLAKLHTIPTEGWGRINGNGIAAIPSWVEFFTTEPDDQLLQAARNIGIEPDKIQLACQLLADNLPAWQDIQPRLLHGDISLNHIMVHEGYVSGLIDFEFPNSGDPAAEIAYWGCWDSFKEFSLPVEWILEGYAQAALVDAAFEFRVRACRLQLSLQLLRYHGNQDAKLLMMVDYLRQRFQRDYQVLKTRK